MMTEMEMLNNPPHYEFEGVGCYLCGSENNDTLLIGEEDLTGKDGEFRYVTCNECGLAFQNPRVAPSQIKDFYDSEYIAHRKKKDWGLLTPLYEHAMSKHDRDKEKLIRQFVSLDEGSRVLDVGCAVGTFLLFLKDKYGCEVSGVDFKDDFDFPRFDEIDFHCGFFYEQEKLKAESYDLITMWHFLEHCYDPMRSLEMARGLLNEGGKLVVEVPRLDSVTYRLYKNKWPGTNTTMCEYVEQKLHTIGHEKTVKECTNEGFNIGYYEA
ncbi:MAG: class I SAM-dependent methyltransferase, partial [Bradymonadia bacterium]